MKENNESVFHMVAVSTELNMVFFEACKSGDKKACREILQKIPADQIIEFFKAQTLNKQNVFQWIYENRNYYHHQDIELVRVLLECMPQGAGTAIFLQKQPILCWLAQKEGEDLDLSRKRASIISLILDKVPSTSLAPFLHNQFIGESRYSKPF